MSRKYSADAFILDPTIDNWSWNPKQYKTRTLRTQETSMLGGGVRCHGGRPHKMHQSFRCDIDKPPTKDKNAKQGFDKYI